ncbi:MAG: hypothetical protein D6819_09405 [Gammaproteobacteria bacterium]|nr:MAG: hypothetical protein D6819_09405 [Gammaproteobacteria bacterium]
MRPLFIDAGAFGLDFDRAKGLADACAAALLGEAMLLSWYDRDRDYESPAHASECHEACDVPGYIDYAESRGAELRVDIDGGRFVFCYLPHGSQGLPEGP